MKTKILTIGRHPEILQTLLRLINQNPVWEGIGTIDEKEAVQLFLQGKYDLVLLGGGIEEEVETKLRAAFTQHNPAIVIIQHYGGGSGLLTGEIFEALAKKNKQEDY